MLRIVVFVVLMSTFGCSSLLDYRRMESEDKPIVNQGSSKRHYIFVNPDLFLVKDQKKQSYHFNQEFFPPDPEWLKHSNKINIFVSVSETDTWTVTHSYGEYYIFQSSDFNERQCRKQLFGDFVNIFGSCHRRNDYGIWVRKEGLEIIGWTNLPGSRRVFTERKVKFILPEYYSKPNLTYLYEWPVLILNN